MIESFDLKILMEKKKKDIDIGRLSQSLDQQFLLIVLQFFFFLNIISSVVIILCATPVKKKTSHMIMLLLNINSVAVVAFIA